MNTTKPVLTPTQRVEAEISDSNQWSEESPNPAVTASFARHMASELEAVQADVKHLRGEISIAGTVAEQLRARIKELEQNYEAECVLHQKSKQSVKELENWKSQMLKVWSQIDDHKIAGMLGAVVGQDNFEVINRRVPEVLEELRQSESGAAELREALEKIIKMNRQHASDQYGNPEKAETWACITVARAALTSTPTGKSMGARSVLELCVESLKTFTTLNSPDVMDYDKASEALQAATQELERSGL